MWHHVIVSDTGSAAFTGAYGPFANKAAAEAAAAKARAANMPDTVVHVRHHAHADVANASEHYTPQELEQLLANQEDA